MSRHATQMSQHTSDKISEFYVDVIACENNVAAYQWLSRQAESVATPEPGLTQLADPDRNLGDARPKPSIKSIYSYKRFRSQIFGEAVSI